MKSAVASLLLLCVCATATAQDIDAQRRRIADERARVNADHEAERRACYRRFAVNDCLDEARQRRNAAVAELRRQDVLLNGAERARRAGERQREVDQRKGAAPIAPAAPAAPVGPVAPGAPPGVDVPLPPGPTRQAVPQAKPGAKARPEPPKREAAEAARNRQAFEARQRQAEAHKAEVLQRNANRGKPPAADLPLPRP